MSNSTHIEGVVIEWPEQRQDQRGWLTELFRHDETDHRPAMSYISVTLPGMSRGPHEHVHQADLFVFLGPGETEVGLWDARPQSVTFGNHISIMVGLDKPCRILVPPGVVHGYRNVSNQPAFVFNAPDRLFAGKDRLEPVDEIRHENDSQSPYFFHGLR